MQSNFLITFFRYPLVAGLFLSSLNASGLPEEGREPNSKGSETINKVELDKFFKVELDKFFAKENVKLEGLFGKFDTAKYLKDVCLEEVIELEIEKSFKAPLKIEKMDNLPNALQDALGKIFTGFETIAALELEITQLKNAKAKPQAS